MDRYPDAAIDFFHLYRRWREQCDNRTPAHHDPLALSPAHLDRRVAHIRGIFDRAIADPKQDAVSAWADITCIQDFPIGHTLEAAGAPDALVHAFNRLLAWTRQHIETAPHGLTPVFGVHQQQMNAPTEH